MTPHPMPRLSVRSNPFAHPHGCDPYPHPPCHTVVIPTPVPHGCDVTRVAQDLTVVTQGSGCLGPRRRHVGHTLFQGAKHAIAPPTTRFFDRRRDTRRSRRSPACHLADEGERGSEKPTIRGRRNGQRVRLTSRHRCQRSCGRPCGEELDRTNGIRAVGKEKSA